MGKYTDTTAKACVILTKDKYAEDDVHSHYVLIGRDSNGFTRRLIEKTLSGTATDKEIQTKWVEFLKTHDKPVKKPVVTVVSDTASIGKTIGNL